MSQEADIRRQDNLKRSMEIAREVKEKLSQQIPILDLRLFGSRARGDDTPESDLDIYIETVSLTRQQHQIISDILWGIGFENGVVIAPVIFSREDIENGPLFASPIYRVIMREGIPV
jgi:predicted nucleotidyltransferase